MSDPASKVGRSAGPIPPQSAADGPSFVVCRCGHQNTAGADQCARPGCRKALPGNALTRRHGLSASLPTAEMREIDAQCRDLFEQSLRDAGGRGELVAREIATHENRALLQASIRKLSLALATHGMFDKRGRLRVTWIGKLESLVSAAVGIDKMLGLQRRARRAPTSFAEAFRQAPELEHD